MILKDWKQTEGAVHLVTPPGGPRPARVEVLAEFLTKQLGKGKSAHNSNVVPAKAGTHKRRMIIA